MKSLITLAGALALSTALSGTALAQTDLTMWYHGAGSSVERELIVGIIDDFNASQDDWKVSLQEFPQAAYNDSVVAAAVSGNLPDIIDVDGPVMPNWAWAGYMQPLAKFVHDFDGRRGTAVNSLVSGDCIVSGGALDRTLLSTGSRVHSYSELHEAVVLPDCTIGRGARLRKVIVDRGINIPEGLVVGEDPEFDAKWFRRSETGVTLITQPMIDKYLESR